MWREVGWLCINLGNYIAISILDMFSKVRHQVREVISHNYTVFYWVNTVVHIRDQEDLRDEFNPVIVTLFHNGSLGEGLLALTPEGRVSGKEGAKERQNAGKRAMLKMCLMRDSKKTLYSTRVIPPEQKSDCWKKVAKSQLTKESAIALERSFSETWGFYVWRELEWICTGTISFMLGDVDDRGQMYCSCDALQEQK